jgi:hypothetical protein
VIDGQPSAGKGWPGGIGSGNACEQLGSITCTSVVSSLGGMLEPERLRIAAAADSIQQDIAIRGGAFESLRQAQDDKNHSQCSHDGSQRSAGVGPRPQEDLSTSGPYLSMKPHQFKKQAFGSGSIIWGDTRKEKEACRAATLPERQQNARAPLRKAGILTV